MQLKVNGIYKEDINVIEIGKNKSDILRGKRLIKFEQPKVELLFSVRIKTGLGCKE